MLLIVLLDGHHLWLHFVREILKLCKLETVFYNPTNFHTYRIINKIRGVLKKRFSSFWGTILTSEETISGKVGRNKLRYYRTFKSHFEFESYLDIVYNVEHRKMMAKLRTSSHTLMCEVGRHYDLPYAASLCQICNSGDVEYEEHFMSKCFKYKSIRDELHIRVNNWLKNAIPEQRVTEEHILKSDNPYVQKAHTYLMHLIFGKITRGKIYPRITELNEVTPRRECVADYNFRQ